MLRVLIIGGYGNFGSFIASKLATDPNIKLIIAGRDAQKAHAFAKTLKAKNKVEYVPIDIHKNFYESLTLIKPGLTIHTSGPFQGQGYEVAKACLEYGCHYVDLADARDFVSGITALDEPAKQRNILICTGASSVPALSSAIIEKYIGQFKTLESVEYAISTAQRANRGLATTQAVLSYAGKAFKVTTPRVNMLWRIRESGYKNIAQPHWFCLLFAARGVTKDRCVGVSRDDMVSFWIDMLHI